MRTLTDAHAHAHQTADCPPAEVLQLLSYAPDRLGHATFLDDDAKAHVRTRKTCVEICLSSNLLCKTVPALDAHHLRFYLAHDHPVAICVSAHLFSRRPRACSPAILRAPQTDDILPFRNSLLGEYAMLLAAPPYGLGLTESEVARIAQMSMDCRFRLGGRMQT